MSLYLSLAITAQPLAVRRRLHQPSECDHVECDLALEIDRDQFCFAITASLNFSYAASVTMFRDTS